MRPDQPEAEDREDLFRTKLTNLVEPRHPLVRLAGLIEWGRLETAFGPLYTDGVGRRGLATRLMAGLPHGRPAPAQAHGRPLGRAMAETG